MVRRLYIMAAVWDGSLTGPGSSSLTGRTPQFAGRMNRGDFERATPHYFGDAPVCIVSVEATPAQHLALRGMSPITAFPADLSATVTAATRDNVVSELEGWGFPAEWVQIGMTYARIAHRLLTLCEVAQLVRGASAREAPWVPQRLLPAGVTPTTTLSELSAAQRRWMRNAAESRGWDVSWAQASTTVREFLRRVINQNARRMRLSRGESVDP